MKHFVNQASKFKSLYCLTLLIRVRINLLKFLNENSNFPDIFPTIHRFAKECPTWSATTTFIAIWQREIALSDPKTPLKSPILVSPDTFWMISTQALAAQSSQSSGLHQKFSTTRDFRRKVMSGLTVSFEKFLWGLKKKTKFWIAGVLMWEVFTCGKMPYGRLKNTEVVERVQRGIILEKPKACAKEIYDVSLKNDFSRDILKFNGIFWFENQILNFKVIISSDLNFNGTMMIKTC